MSSINLHPTFHYSQPEDYRFSHDSVFLAREIFELHHTALSRPSVRILDLCAGCGIVGLDLLFHLLKEAEFRGQIDFLEVQGVYKDHFTENVKRLKEHFPHQNPLLKWREENYGSPLASVRYDFILSNPPYFLTEHGAQSPNQFKNRCRFFVDSGWRELISFIKNSLTENGIAYFLVRDDLKILIEKNDLSEILFPFKIRGTWVAQIAPSTAVK